MNIKNVVIKFEEDYRKNSMLLATNLCSILEKAGYICTKQTLHDWGNDDLDVDVVIHIQGYAPYYTKPWNYNILLTQAYAVEAEKKVFPVDAEIDGKNYDAVHIGQDFETTILALLTDASQADSHVESRITVAKEKIIDPEFCTDGPLVSILMGTYNRRKYLPRALKSILSQTYKNWELCLICDGGDAVDDIVEGFNDSRIKLINLEKNMGLGHGFNLAFQESQGEYIAYLGDDDIFLPDHIEKLMRTVCNIPGLSFVYSDAMRITVETDQMGNEKIIDRTVCYSAQVGIDQLLEFNFITGISVLHERALFMQAGGFDPKLAVLIDFDMWRRMACYAYPYHVSAVTAEYFVHNKRQERHITDILHAENGEKYIKNRLKILFKKLPIEKNELYRNEVQFARRRALFHFYTTKCANNMDKDSKLARALLNCAKRNYVKKYPIQMAYALCLMKCAEFSQALDVYKDILSDNVAANTELFMALYCALELHDEYAFTVFTLLSENKKKMNDQELLLFKDYSLKMKKVFRKRYYEWSETK